MDATKEQAKDFLNKIKKKDKVALVFHDDLDGFASGVLIYDFLKKKGCDLIYTTFTNGEEVPKKEFFKDREYVIITDIGSNLIYPIFSFLEDKKVLIIDHHVPDVEIPKSFVDYRISKEYVPASKMSYDLIGGKKWIAVAGVLADLGQTNPNNIPFINEFLNENSIALEDYQENVVYKITHFLVYFNTKNKLNKSFEFLLKLTDWRDLKIIEKYSIPVEKEIDKFVDGYEKHREIFNKINFYKFNPKFKIKGIVATIISIRHPEDISVLYSAPEEGNKMKVSARNHSKKFSMVDLMKAGVVGLENASAGGHIPAAGANFQAKDLDKFKKNLISFSKNW